jgi:hypothetical protein
VLLGVAEDRGRRRIVSGRKIGKWPFYGVSHSMNV